MKALNILYFWCTDALRLRRLAFFVLLINALVIVDQLQAQMGGGNSLMNQARAWLIGAPSASATITPAQNGMGWADGAFTIQTPYGALQFSATGSPAEPVMTWDGRIVAEHIDVTSMSLFASPPLTSASAGTAGQMAYDGTYFYVCTALNTWKRAALSTW